MTVQQPLAQVVGHVCQTMDYSLFKTLKGNRTINQAHLHRLTKSIRDKYLLSPIVVNERFEIIDGQHRFNAAKDNGLPINYIIAQGYGLKEVQILNTNSSNWGSMDYLNAYCDMGLKPYLRFRKFLQDWPDFSFNSAYAIVTQSRNSSLGTSSTVKSVRSETNKKGNVLKNIFKEGGLVNAPDFMIEESAKKISDYKKFYPNFHRQSFVISLIGIFQLEHYDHDKMMAKLKLQPAALVDCTNARQYRKLLTDIYNYKNQNKVTLEF